MSTLYVDTINEKTLNNGVQIPGHVVQVESVYTYLHQTVNTTSFTDITNMSVSITPTSSSSKILVIVSLSASKENNHSGLVRLLRDGTVISGGAGSGSHINGIIFNIRDSNQYSVPNFNHTFLDSPSTTSSVTYKIQGKTTNATYPMYINRSRRNDTTQDYESPASSTITVMEIAQ